MKNKVLIIGLGKIGFNYDIKKKYLIHSHAKALMLNNNFVLIGAVEKKYKIRKIFEKKFNLPTYNNLEKAFSVLNPSLVIISSPTSTHLKVFEELVKIQKKKKIVKNVVIEKPVGANFNQTNKILKLAKKNKIKIFVNYIRQYQRDLLSLFNFVKIKNFKYSEVHYNKGLRNNASHFICLMISFFGNIQQIKLLKKDLKNPSFKIKFKKNECFFYSKKKKKNICDIWFKKKENQIGLINNSKIIVKKLNNKITKKKRTNMNKYQKNVYESIFNNLKKNKKILINDKIVLSTSKVIDKIENL
jgi:hypothetical protein